MKRVLSCVYARVWKFPIVGAGHKCLLVTRVLKTCTRVHVLPGTGNGEVHKGFDTLVCLPVIGHTGMYVGLF